MNLVFFIVGVVTGGVVCYLYLQGIRASAPDEALMQRVQVLEEQLAALTSVGFSSLGATARTNRTRKANAPSGKQERVLALHREGWDCAKISQETGVPIGQVELLTRLHGKE